MNEQNPAPEPLSRPVLREDTPIEYPHIDKLLQNAPVLKDGCPAVPLVMEDV